MIKKIDILVNHKLGCTNDIEENMYIELEREHRINFLLKNYEKLRNIKGICKDKSTLYIYALTCTLRGICIDCNKINDSIKTIKENTLENSNFRGSSLINTAIAISNTKNPKESLGEIIDIYDKLNKNNCEENQLLIFIANKIFENKKHSSIIKSIEKMKYIYENIKNKSAFRESLDDYTIVYLIASNSERIDEDLKSVEKIYENLSKNILKSSNTLKSLSYVLSFSKDLKAVDKFIKLKEAIEKAGIKIIDSGLPILGGLSLIDIDDISKLINEIKAFLEKLKKYDLCNEVYLKEEYRNIIAIGLALSKYHCDMKMEYAFSKKSIKSISQGIDISIMSSAASSILVASKDI